MKYWEVKYSDEAKKDRMTLDASAKRQVDKAVRKVSENPLSQSEGGYGKPLGNKRGKNLTGLFKVKLLKLGIRIVYKLIRNDEVMRIIVVAARSDDEVYEIASDRIKCEKTD